MFTGKIKLSYVIEELAEERGMDRDTLTQAVTEGILAAYQKKYSDLELFADYNKRDDLLTVMVKKTVVTSVENDDSQISLKKARAIKSDIELGDKLDLVFDGQIGRIEIAKARQIIAQSIRVIEAEAVYKEFLPRVGSIVNGTVHKVEPAGVVVLLNDIHALIPRQNIIAEEKYLPGHPIRALLKEVLELPRYDSQVILDRSSTEFIQKLLILEIPEIFDGLVRIEKIVRVSGYKTKVLVSSSDMHVDPVGTCIGVAGARIKPILRELNIEKIDIIPLVKDKAEQVAQALKPAAVDSVDIVEGVAYVTLPHDQRSAAIGKGGKNIMLASQLTGFSIELTRSAQDEEEHFFGKAS